MQAANKKAIRDQVIKDILKERSKLGLQSNFDGVCLDKIVAEIKSAKDNKTQLTILAATCVAALEDLWK
jgi:hypothetical protein